MPSAAAQEHSPIKRRGAGDSLRAGVRMASVTRARPAGSPSWASANVPPIVAVTSPEKLSAT